MTSARGRRAKATDRVSQIGENYLQSLYKLKEEGLRPSAGNLTDYIRRLPREEGVGTSLPSILGMLRRMAKEGLVTIMPNKEVELDPCEARPRRSPSSRTPPARRAPSRRHPGP